MSLAGEAGAPGRPPEPRLRLWGGGRLCARRARGRSLSAAGLGAADLGPESEPPRQAAGALGDTEGPGGPSAGLPGGVGWGGVGLFRSRIPATRLNPLARGA